MEHYYVLLLFAIACVFFVRVDEKNKHRAESEPDYHYDPNSRLTTLATGFAPFSVLFYSDNFWLHMLYLLPLYVHFWMVMVFYTKQPWFNPETTMVFFQGVGGAAITVLIYYLFFHEGVLVETEADITSSAEVVTPSLLADTNVEQAVTTVMDAAATISPTEDSGWPFLIFVALIFSALLARGFERVMKREGNLSSMLILANAIVLPILPLFTSNYWGGIVAGVIALIVMMASAASGVKDSDRAVIFIYGYVYMMVFIVSLFIYAVLF